MPKKSSKEVSNTKSVKEEKPEKLGRCTYKNVVNAIDKASNEDKMISLEQIIKIFKDIKLDTTLKRIHKKEKDPNAPKKPKSEWAKFQEWMRPKLTEQGIGHKDMFKAIGSKWQEYKKDESKMKEFRNAISK